MATVANNSGHMQFTSVASQVPSCIWLHQEEIFGLQIDITEVAVFMFVEASFRGVSTVKALQLLTLDPHQGEEECPPELEHTDRHVCYSSGTYLIL